MREVWQLWNSRSLPPSLPCQVGSCLFFSFGHYTQATGRNDLLTTSGTPRFLLLCVISKRSFQSTILAVKTATMSCPCRNQSVRTWVYEIPTAGPVPTNASDTIKNNGELGVFRRNV